MTTTQQANGLSLKPATRQGVKPLIGLYSESGCGKTYSSLLLARGFVGDGRIAMIDTESGRGSLYADVIPGGYDVLELRQPFSPQRYIEAIDAIEATDAGILVIDSASHEWEGIGGVLDMAGENEAKSGKPGLHNWRQPKLEHSKFMLRLLQSRLPIIVCLRAKYKTRQGKDERGKTAIIKDEYTTPIQADDFIFEMTAHAEILHDHSLKLTKCSHPSLRQAFPESGPLTTEHGKALAGWCNNPLKRTPAPDDDPVKAIKAKIWNACESVRGTAKTWAGIETWMVARKILNEGQKIAALTLDELREAYDKACIELNP